MVLYCSEEASQVCLAAIEFCSSVLCSVEFCSVEMSERRRRTRQGSKRSRSPKESAVELWRRRRTSSSSWRLIFLLAGLAAVEISALAVQLGTTIKASNSTADTRPLLANGGGNQNEQQTTSINSASSSSSSRSLEKRATSRPQARHHQATQTSARISDTDLLPFSEFIVHQPAFSDIMKTWPPTTLNSEQKRLQQQQQQQERQQQQEAQQRAHRHRPSPFTSAVAADGNGGEVHNHLNEDLDDTMVTADESFEIDQLPEPATWVNYLGELGDFIYVQLREFYSEPSSLRSPFFFTTHQTSQEHTSNTSKRQSLRVAETVEDLLDDFYYDQYENSQVLYYGPQLAREGDIVEIGCYLPRDQPAEWTKSGQALNVGTQLASSLPNSLAIIKRTEFLGAKQNFSVKIFEAHPSDSGNYRCNRMSRKYHKLVVVPARLPAAQLYSIQQRLLRVVRPQAAAVGQQQQQAAASYGSAEAQHYYASGLPLLSAQQAKLGSRVHTDPAAGGSSRARITNNNKVKQILPPGHLITEGQPLLVHCNISDESVLRRLREQPQFQLAWYKNRRRIRASQQQQQYWNNSSTNRSAQRQQASITATTTATTTTTTTTPNQRIQFVGANGRQMYISAAIYSDAGDYLCSWSGLPVRQLADDDEQIAATNNNNNNKQVSANPLAPGNFHQLLAPVKLRPFKSAYHVRAGDQMRLVCQVQRAYPQAQISWYIGNRLVDGDFLREHPNEFRIIQYTPTDDSNSNQQHTILIASPAPSQEIDVDRLVEINPVPAQRQQMQLTANGRGSWIEFKHLKGPNAQPEKLAIETTEQQLSYMSAKLDQLVGRQYRRQQQQQQQRPELDAQAALNAAISMLVVNKLDTDKHSSRYSCRATTRANTDEVTTVIRVKDSATRVVKPTTAAATLIQGQPLHFECEQSGNPSASFRWKKQEVGQNETKLLEPVDDEIVPYNGKLILKNPDYRAVGDYICFIVQDEDKEESAVIKVRTQPYIEDFGIETSHTGKSATITDGERLELVCHVPDRSAPVTITWLRSETSDDDRSMVPIAEIDSKNLLIQEQSHSLPLSRATPTSMPGDTPPTAFDEKTYSTPSIFVEKVDDFTKKLIVDQVGPEHRGHYTCLVDNDVTEKSRKTIFIRVKDKIVALWPLLAILAELFILFTIIYVWETRKAYKETQQVTSSKSTDSKNVTSSTSGATSKRAPSGPANAFESVPLNK